MDISVPNDSSRIITRDQIENALEADPIAILTGMHKRVVMLERNIAEIKERLNSLFIETSMLNDLLTKHLRDGT